jgi:hypothetical protein
MNDRDSSKEQRGFNFGNAETGGWWVSVQVKKVRFGHSAVDHK